MRKQGATGLGVFALPAVLLLAGCAGGNLIEKAGTDPTLITGSVSTSVLSTVDEERASDEATIRNAVSSVNIEELKDASIPWANPGTGSRGAISSITEYREGDKLCRRFVASRESYAGVSLFNGDACLHGSGLWLMRAFRSA